MEVKVIPKKTVTVIPPKNKFYVDKEKYNQKRVAAYCRDSTDSEEQLTSYNTQKKVYTEMILSNKEWTLVDIYADEGISGTQAKKRDEFNRMIKDCLDGKIDYIITKSVSRFARNTVECLDYVRMLKARGIGIIFEEQNIDTLKTDSELYLVIYAGFAQSESESISKNITWAVRKNFEDGIVRYNYKRMVGYKKGADGKPEIIPEEAEIIKEIFSAFISGKTVREICDKLLADGVQTKCGKQIWKPATILGILRNEKYCGDAILQKTVTVDCISKKKKKNTGDAPMYYVHNAHAPIISREDFNKAQEKLVSRSAIQPASAKSMTAQGRYSRYALTDVLKCGECGTRYRRCSWNIRGVKKIVWRCVNRLENGKTYCKNSPTLEETALHEAIVRAVNKLNSGDSETYKSLMKVSLNEALGLNGGTEEIDLLTRRIEALNTKMLGMINESVSSGKGMEDSEGEFKELSDEIKQLNSRIDAIKAAMEADNTACDRMKEIARQVDEMQDGITEYDDGIVRQMIECIKVYGDGRLEVIFGGGYMIEEHI